MPRNVKLSERGKGQIDALRTENKAFRAIARQIGRSEYVVRHYCADPENYGKLKSSGRPRALSARDERRISKIASNSTKSCSEIRKEAGLTVSNSTILRSINRNSNLIRSKMMSAPRLKLQHKNARMNFARSNMNRQWNTIRKIYNFTLLHF